MGLLDSLKNMFGSSTAQTNAQMNDSQDMHKKDCGCADGCDCDHHKNGHECCGGEGDHCCCGGHAHEESMSEEAEVPEMNQDQPTE